MSIRISMPWTPVAALLVPAVLSAELELPKTWREPEVDHDGGKRVEREFRVIPPKQPKVDLSLGSSVLYDSNPRLTPNGSGSAVFSYQLGVLTRIGNEIDRGAFYELRYGLSGFEYSDSSLSAPGGTSLDHRIHAKMGLNLARTKFRLSSNYARNGGNTVDFDGLNREARVAESDDFDFEFQLVRELDHGSLEAKLGAYRRSFRDPFLNDGTGHFLDLAWYFQPSFAPKSELGVGFRTGTDNFDGVADQRFYTPSLRWRHRVSGKTTFQASIGNERRKIEGGTASSINNFIYSGGVTWEPSPKTAFELSVGKRVSPSLNSGNGSYEASEAVMRMRKRIGKNFLLTGTVGVENADYFDARSAALADRDDSFLKAGLNLQHPIKIGPKGDGHVDVFYQYNQNESSINQFDFEQHVTGVRFGVAF